MTFFQKILNFVSLTMILFVFIAGSPIHLYSQLNNEQQNQIKQYNQIINEYKAKNQLKMAVHYSNRKASVYLNARMYQEAIDSYIESADLNDKAGNDANNLKIYNNIGIIYWEIGQVKNSQKFYEKKLTLARRYNNKYEISIGIMDVAQIMITSRQYEKALGTLEEAWKVSHDINNPKLIGTCAWLMSQCYSAAGNKKKAEEFNKIYEANKSYITRDAIKEREEGFKEDISDQKKIANQYLFERDLLKERAELDEKIAAFEKDSLNRVLKAQQDSIDIIETKRSKDSLTIANLNKDKIINENIKKSLEIQNENQKLWLFGGSIILLFLAMLIVGSVFVLRQRRRDNKELERRNLLIEKERDEKESKNLELSEANMHIQLQNKGIMQSINYAQRIQEAMLPKQQILKSLMPDSFIFFKPRDIVSGDFYWFDEVVKKKNGSTTQTDGDNIHKIFVSAVDCTGHGVPGAFMSMLGFNLLNDIVRRGTTESNKILNSLHEGIRKSLNQVSTQNRDGMDMALCVIDPVNKIMEYSGAQNPLIYIQDGQVYRVRGNKFPVGGFQLENHNFTKHLISIDKPTTCYIFSDGFPDQFGGPDGRKFMAKNFRDLLYEIYQMPMDEQEKILDLVINEWMGNNEQTDDILVIGFRIDLQQKPMG
ncbi:MAG: SpoIIE family protein phosphatase [Bacteroidales bacterium]